MIDHIITTVSNLPKSKEFYEKALAPLGYCASPEFTSASMNMKGVGFGVKEEGLDFHIVQGPTIVNPTHIAFRVNRNTNRRHSVSGEAVMAKFEVRVGIKQKCRLFFKSHHSVITTSPPKARSGLTSH